MLIATCLTSSITPASERYFDNQICQLKTYVDPSIADPEYDHPNGAESPLYFDSATGVMIDPVSGKIRSFGSEFGIVRDAQTGARFSTTRGLWLDEKTMMPLQSKRLNSFPYYDPETNQTIDVLSGNRYPYQITLMTIGQQRTAADAIRWACLGDDLSQRIDPVTRRYLVRTNLGQVNDTLFNSYDGSPKDFKLKHFDGDRSPPSAFPTFSHFYDQTLNEFYGLKKGQSRTKVLAILYDKFAPESPEGGGQYQLHEARVRNGLVILVTATGLLDDALSGIQFMLFFDTSLQGQTRLMNFGAREKCGRIESIGAWIKKHC